MIYSNNNKIYKDNSENIVPNTLDESSADMANYGYPRELEFGINYDIIDSDKFAYKNIVPKVTYFLNNRTVTNHQGN